MLIPYVCELFYSIQNISSSKFIHCRPSHFLVCVGLYSFPAFAQPYGIGSVEDDLVNDFTQRRYNQPTELFLCLCKQNRPTLQRALSNALILISSNGGGVVGGGGVGWCGDDVVWWW